MLENIQKLLENVRKYSENVRKCSKLLENIQKVLEKVNYVYSCRSRHFVPYQSQLDPVPAELRAERSRELARRASLTTTSRPSPRPASELLENVIKYSEIVRNC